MKWYSGFRYVLILNVDTQKAALLAQTFFLFISGCKSLQPILRSFFHNLSKIDKGIFRYKLLSIVFAHTFIYGLGFKFNIFEISQINLKKFLNLLMNVRLFPTRRYVNTTIRIVENLKKYNL